MALPSSTAQSYTFKFDLMIPDIKWFSMAALQGFTNSAYFRMRTAADKRRRSPPTPKFVISLPDETPLGSVIH